MMTELNEPKAPIRIDVVQNQFKNGMQLDELARLYDVKQEMLEPIVRDIRQKERKICNEEFHYKNLSRDELIEALERKPTAFSFKRFAGIRSNEEMWALLEQHGLSHMILTKEQEVEERNRQIVNALESGASYKDVAKQLGVSTSTVQKRAKRMKMENSVKEAESHALDYRELADRISRLFKQGLTMTEVIEETGISRATYYRVKKTRGENWNIVDGRKGRHKKTQQPKDLKDPKLIIPTEPKEEPPVKETTTASLESAVTAFKAEEVSELIGEVQKHIEHKKPSPRIINRDKDVWAEYLTARSEEIHDVAHTVDVVLEEGKLIERTVLSYTLEREVTR